MSNFTVSTTVPVLTVFAQGILSFLSPCVLPLLPLYIGYLSGTYVQNDTEKKPACERQKMILRTLCFVIGVSFAFFLLGMGMSAVALVFRKRQRLFSIAGGIIVILFGCYQTGLFGHLPFLDAEKRITPKTEVTGALSALMLGFFFSFAWTPCVGPALATVLLMAGASASRAYGFLLIGVYALGFCIPFLLTGLFTTTLLSFLKAHRGVVRYTKIIGGVLMIVTGLLMVTGYLQRVSAALAVYGS